MWLLPRPTACQKDGHWKSGRRWISESSVELHHSRRKYCRRPTGARMDPRFTQKTVKFGGGKIMVWGYIQYGGVREICRVGTSGQFVPKRQDFCQGLYMKFHHSCSH